MAIRHRRVRQVVGLRSKAWRPVPGPRRYRTLDVLRGVAVFGMLPANVLIFGLPEEARGLPDHEGLALVLGLFVEGKFYTLFAILFGMGLALQSGRAEAGDAFVRSWLRRMSGLILFGLLHGLFLFHADILLFYGMMGLVAVLFRRVGSRKTLAWASASYLTGLIVLGGFLLRYPDRSLPAGPDWRKWALEHEIPDAVGGTRANTAADVAGGTPEETLPPDVSLVPLVLRLTGTTRGELSSFMSREEEIFRDGTWRERVRFRTVSYLAVGLPLRLVFSSWMVLGLFLFGMYLAKRRFLLDPAKGAAGYARLAAVGIPVGLLLELIGGVAQLWGGPAAVPLYLVGTFLGIVVLSLGYAGLVACVSARFSSAVVVGWPAAVGRMAFTNYVGQSVMCGLLFSGGGLAWFGERDGWTLMALTVGILLAETVCSVVWLNRSRFGPLEWSLRAFAYGVRL